MSDRLCLLLVALVAQWPLHAVDDSAKEAQFLSNTRQLIYEGRRSGEGYFSADGKFLVFQSEREADNPFYQIYLLNLETGDVNRVSPGTGKTTCAFLRPGSDDVIYASTHTDPEAKAKQKSEPPPLRVGLRRPHGNLRVQTRRLKRPPPDRRAGL